ncbi:MAG: VacJ family lipoprotein [Rhodospirillales bacterium]|nr:VacJ family lipoprotein [Rhodospirillales bacterium]
MDTVFKLFSRMIAVTGVAAAFAVALGVGSPAWAEAPQTAQVVADESDDSGDPLEPVNRFLFEFNEIFQMVILRPATGMYQHLIPPAVREAIGHMIDNLKAPVILANDLLQGEGDRAWVTTQRFVVNTTLGVGGIMDPATKFGLTRHSEDFGQTLAVWGVGEGLYLVLPFYGPSNPRDAVGKLFVDNYFDPLGMYLENTNEDEARYARMSVGGVDEYGGVMDDLEQIKKTSVDYYAAIRSMYRQKRKAEISNGTEVDLPPIPDLGQMPDGTPAEQVSLERK